MVLALATLAGCEETVEQPAKAVTSSEPWYYTAVAVGTGPEDVPTVDLTVTVVRTRCKHLVGVDPREISVERRDDCHVEPARNISVRLVSAAGAAIANGPTNNEGRLLADLERSKLDEIGGGCSLDVAGEKIAIKCVRATTPVRSVASPPASAASAAPRAFGPLDLPVSLRDYRFKYFINDQKYDPPLAVFTITSHHAISKTGAQFRVLRETTTACIASAQACESASRAAIPSFSEVLLFDDADVLNVCVEPSDMPSVRVKVRAGRLQTVAGGKPTTIAGEANFSLTFASEELARTTASAIADAAGRIYPPRCRLLP